jgi:CoA-transferase family III
LGYGTTTRRRLRPGLIDVCLDAYGWSGPWATRRGFDSLVQMSTGIAEAGMRGMHAGEPKPLPVQALDHATGYLMAAAAIRGVKCRLTQGNGTHACLSLARTAMVLIDQQRNPTEPQPAPESQADCSSTIEATEWGDARRVNPPAEVDGAVMSWAHPASSLGSAKPEWSESP